MTVTKVVNADGSISFSVYIANQLLTLEDLKHLIDVIENDKWGDPTVGPTIQFCAPQS